MIGMGAALVGPVDAQIQFDPPVEYPGVDAVREVAVGDMNSDNRLDVIALHVFGEIVVYLNRGGMEFDLGLILGPGLREGRDLASGDIDNDGFDDFAWIDYSAVTVLYGDGTGYDGEIHAVNGGSDPRHLALGDLDDDGDLDLVIANRDDTIVCRQEDDRSFTMVSAAPMTYGRIEGLDLGDFDGDGDLDIAVLDNDSYEDYRYGYKILDSTLHILLNSGNGEIERQVATPLPFGGYSEYEIPRAIRMTDINNDGTREIVMAVGGTQYDAESYVAVLMNLGDGHVSTDFDRVPISNGNIYRDIYMEAADLDFDGDIDLMLTNGTTHSTTLMENLDGSGDFLRSSVSHHWTIYENTPADLDGDGIWDLAIGDERGITLRTNATSLDIPMLSVSTLRHGEDCELVVEDAAPGESVHFLVAERMPGDGVGQFLLGGATLDLPEQFRRITSRRADDNGTAIARITVPAHTPASRYTFQAVARRGPRGADSVKTNFVTRGLVD